MLLLRLVRHRTACWKATAETRALLPRFTGMPSTVIRRYDYDPEQNRLEIEFVSGEAYSYFGVPEAVVSGLTDAFSKGRYFRRHIRDRFDFRRDRAPRAGRAQG